MSEVEALKAAARREVDQIAKLLIETSDWMYANPEIGLQEHQASARLTEILSEFGATVERGIAGMPTAFAADLPAGKAGPKVAIIAEYDALPEVGHGCGHNIIATAALGASLALARLGARLPGQVVVVGTPAEESAVPNAGGKIPILDHGYFKGVDAAIMMHPWTSDGAPAGAPRRAHPRHHHTWRNRAECDPGLHRMPLPRSRQGPSLCARPAAARGRVC
jgi:amidohydrolase